MLQSRLSIQSIKLNFLIHFSLPNTKLPMIFDHQILFDPSWEDYETEMKKSTSTSSKVKVLSVIRVRSITQQHSEILQDYIPYPLFAWQLEETRKASCDVLVVAVHIRRGDLYTGKDGMCPCAIICCTHNKHSHGKETTVPLTISICSKPAKRGSM